jgi:TonB family protein
MSLGQVNNTFGAFGSAAAPRLAPAKPPVAFEPKLEVRWDDFRQSLASSLRAILTRPDTPKKFFTGPYFRDCWIDRRIPRRAVIAAALWHVAIFVMPFPNLPMAPRRNHAFDNVELAWSGPINDLPLLEIPAAKSQPKPSPRGNPDKPLPPKGADAFHPRQRIFTDPVHPTHPRQTLINPAAPPTPPKLLPNLPNIVQLQPVVGPPRPRLQISAEALAKLHPRQRRAATVTATPLPDVQVAAQKPAEIPLAPSTNAPARPKLELNAGAAPRVAPRTQTGDTTPAPELGTNQPSASNGASAALIAISATPGPPAPVQPPQGNLSARVSISPEGTKPGVPGGSSTGTSNSNGGSGGTPDSNGGAGTGSGGGKSSVGVSISGGDPPANAGVSGLGPAPRPKINVPSARSLITRPEPNGKTDDPPERTGPPNFAALPAGAKPEQIFASKRVYTLYVNMANLNSATGSWIMNFSELRTSPDAPHVISADLSGPVPIKKVDPKYPPTLKADNVEGEVILYAVIRADGSVDSIQLVRGIDEQLDANAMDALSQWKFRPATKAGVPVDLEAIVHIPFRLRDDR